MTQAPTDNQLANEAASVIRNAFDTYQIRFRAITLRAKGRFENLDWHGIQADAAERLDLYKSVVDETVELVSQLLGLRLDDTQIWERAKTLYAVLVADLDLWELAETFFNSVTRRIFATVGVNPRIEFVDTCSRTQLFHLSQTPYRTYRGARSTAILIENILADYEFEVGYKNAKSDALLVAEQIDAQLEAAGYSPRVERAEMLNSIFYRGKGAYLVGRILKDSRLFPLVLALLNTPRGIMVDAVLLNENEVSILFSFTRSYFHVDVSKPSELVSFLKSIVPRKRIAELYISIGYNKHGKSELYCDLLQHLASSRDKFEIAEGEPGLVMTVFTMPDYDLVFKVIKDRFSFAKKTTREGVMAKYYLVFKHDRAGRLVDAQEFEHLKFSRRRFSDALLGRLLRDVSRSVAIDEDYVIVKHAYVERRVTPLDIYIREADEAAARAAVVDYGKAIKDLAATNIFPGDMLLKNFGVTRHGRVVFYDYDELCLLSDCSFRVMPSPRSHEEELADEPWFMVGEHDIFPEEFRRFLGLRGDLREVFLEHHGDLFEANFWQRIQERVKAGKIIDIFPYEQSKRLVSSRQQAASNKQ